MPGETVAPELATALEAALAAELGDESVAVFGLRRLSGGASRETWSFDLRRGDGRVEELVLRKDPAGAPRGTMVREGLVIDAAGVAGVPVPAIVMASDGPAVLGSSFLVMERLEGETIARRILRDDAYGAARLRLAGDCGEALARLHGIDPDSVPGLEGGDQLTQFRGLLDELGQPHPAFELALRWLEAHRPEEGPLAVVHGDFRNGNLVVGPDGLRGVLDWELVHVGDPLEDLGWLCVKSWRFGVDLPVGGFGPYEQLVDAYHGAGGRRVDPVALRWWEILGNLKWGVMCILQTVTHTSGAVRSVELAAIGRRVCEVEWDLLGLLGLAPAALPPVQGPGATAGERGSSLHDIPTAAGLVEAVREFLAGDVRSVTEGRVQFHARVATNVLAMVERELTLGPEQSRVHADGLARLGVGSEAELATAIRTGGIDDRDVDVGAFVRQTVEAKLRVANPGYLAGPVAPAPGQ